MILYDSDSFCVVHTPTDSENCLPNEGSFEIVRKHEDQPRITSLVGPQALAFNTQIEFWKTTTPTQEAVEHTLDCYSQLGANPLCLH